MNQQVGDLHLLTFNVASQADENKHLNACIKHCCLKDLDVHAWVFHTTHFYKFLKIIYLTNFCLKEQVSETQSEAPMWMAGTQVSLPPRMHRNRKQELTKELGLKPRHSLGHVYSVGQLTLAPRKKTHVCELENLFEPNEIFF